ncbi:sulfite exporter TauE/SafE family protein [Moraxella sp. FZFQ2102]|uniref:sulfite exporter TauE/SafE family protein n=1 Tax=Moraxella sp. FZFQ2102 TaxID=2953752 RepID=UPI00209C16F3|nr:sulfite exporter TauE/SafE family protein [Moraxella sp. FZFQ2102]USZ15262.1 sulfite exporter TauE/SafE family protein [Moraxella sp. FZFQ2102]
MSIVLVFAALSMGLLGSPHCLGMCGGIVAAFSLSMQSQSPAKKALLMAGYHLGRLGSYLILGVIASLLGQEILSPLMANGNFPKYLLGGALVFAALLMLGVPVLNRLEKAGLGLWNALAPIRTKVLPMDNLPKAVAAGLLWGFLPCGLVYGALGVALSLSADQQIGLSAAGFMVFFWLGTLPMLLATGSLIHWLRSKIANFHLRKFSGAILLISGLAIAFSSPIMQAMHGGHGGHSDHGTHSTTHANHDTMDHNSHSDHSNHSEHSHH